MSNRCKHGIVGTIESGACRTCHPEFFAPRTPEPNAATRGAIRESRLAGGEHGAMHGGTFEGGGVTIRWINPEGGK